MTHTHKHTHLQTAPIHHADQSLQKSVFFSTQEEFYFFLPSLRCFNFFPTHWRHKLNSTMTAKHTADKDFNHSTDRTPAGNSGFKKLAVQWLNQVQFFNQTFVQVDSDVLRNRQLLKPENVSGHCKGRQCNHKQTDKK